MKQIIFFILLFTTIVYSQPIDTTSTGGTTGLNKSQVESLVGDSTYVLRQALANKELSNLGTTSINTNLVPSVSAIRNIGSSTFYWNNVYLKTIYIKGLSGNFAINLNSNILTTTRNVYFPNKDGIIAMTSDLASYAPLASPTFTGSVTLPSSTSIGTVSNIELLYLDGVTSGIQSQLDSKATAPSGTINELAYFNTSSTISSLGVAAYPSLAELSYVKNVTSSIQTQLNAKANATSLSSYLAKTDTTSLLATKTALGDSVNLRLHEDFRANYSNTAPTIGDYFLFNTSGTNHTATLDALPISDSVQAALDDKQDVLVSGTNIKTVNGNSLLGSGNITIQTTDSNVVNDLIATKLDTMASDTSNYTLAEIDKAVKNSMIQNYEIKNIAISDEFTIFWTDDSLRIDSIQCESDDSVTIQIDLSHTATNVFTTAQLINGITTLSTFAEDSITDKATLQFTQLGDNLGYLRLRIYWSFL